MSEASSSMSRTENVVLDVVKDEVLDVEDDVFGPRHSE